MKRVTDHLAAHPIRLLVTMVVPLMLSAVLATFAIWQAVKTSEQNDVSICQQVNELKEDIYVTIVDLTYMFMNTSDAERIQHVFAKRFLPIKDCQP